MDFIHNSWTEFDLTNIFILFDSITEKLKNINIQDGRKINQILEFLKTDVSNVNVVYLKYKNIEDVNESDINEYLNNGMLIKIPYNMNIFKENLKNTKELDHIWSPLIKELLSLLSSKIKLIHVQRNRNLTKTIINNISPNNIMRFSYEINRDTTKLYDVILKLYDLKQEYKLTT